MTPSLRPTHPIRGLTAVRGVAAWWVVLFHFREALPAGVPRPVMAFADHGYLAVDLFFELSGFVIALSYAGKLSGGENSGHGRTLWIAPARVVARFLGLRVARIYPLHLFTLGLCLIQALGIATLSRQQAVSDRFSAPSFWLNVSLMQNWGFLDHLSWNVPAWSISVEWFAYLAFPVMCWGLLKFRKGSLWLAAAIACLLIVLAAFTAATGQSLGDDIPRTGLARCLLEFSAGMCLLRLRAGRMVALRHDGDPGSLLAVVCVGAYVVLPIPDYATIPLGFLGAIYALSDPKSLLSRIMNWRFLEYLGSISYSTYMIHYIVKDFVKIVFVKSTAPSALDFMIYLIITAVASEVLYRRIEQPGGRAMRAILIGRR